MVNDQDDDTLHGSDAMRKPDLGERLLFHTMGRNAAAADFNRWREYCATAQPTMSWEKLRAGWHAYVGHPEPSLTAANAAQLLRIAAHSTAKTTKDWDAFEEMCLKVLQAAGAR